jgi:hypothetical protein
MKLGAPKLLRYSMNFKEQLEALTINYLPSLTILHGWLRQSSLQGVEKQIKNNEIP